jgi:hypothetical protein
MWWIWKFGSFVFCLASNAHISTSTWECTPNGIYGMLNKWNEIKFRFFTGSLSESSLYKTSGKFSMGFRLWKHLWDVHTRHSFVHFQQRMHESYLGSSVTQFWVYIMLLMYQCQILWLKIVYNLERLVMQSLKIIFCAIKQVTSVKLYQKNYFHTHNF